MCGRVLSLWDLESKPPKVIQEERQHTAYIPAIATAPGAATFATASADQSIGIWDATTHKRIARWRAHTREAWAAAMSPDGRPDAGRELLDVSRPPHGTLPRADFR
jgi:WD40 repeat protein